ncbi:MAG: pyridoxal-dependent decarboxylase [Vicinamibacterales bacterium]
MDRLDALEAIARRLDPSPEARAALMARAVRYADAFLDSLPDRPVFVPTADQGAGIRDLAIRDEPREFDELLDAIARHVDRPGINPASPGHLGYIPGGGVVQAALGDFLADITNKYAGVFFAAPGAVRLENLLTEWMASLVGYPASSAGNLASGGSIANLIAIVTARDAKGVTSREVERSVVYATAHVHHSVDKALRIAGLRECPVRHVPMDARHRMDAAALERLVEADRAAGLRPFLVVASAGTTDAGAIDPMPAIADVAGRHGLWFHVDAAYGGFFALCEAGRRRLAGMERSDSIIMDPHKGLFLPFGTGAVLVKDRRAVLDSHYYVASYMQDALAAREEPSPADLSPELTKHFRGLRLWLPLQLCGVAPFRAAIEEKMLLARYFHDRVSRLPGFEVGPEPELSIATFRYVPPRGDADAFNEALVQAVQRDGRVFMTSTRIDGRFVLRAAILVFRTHRDTIDRAIDILQAEAARLAAG